MSPHGGGGADDDPVDPAETLVPLVREATVRIHGSEPGYPLRGSGFFVAPNWVLTCAHVALAGQEGAVGEAARKVTVGHGDRMLTGVVEWAEPAVSPGPGHRWPAPDLALIRLLDHADHPCVWLTERTAKGYTTNQVAFFGYVPTDGATGDFAASEEDKYQEYNGRCTISGQLGNGGILKLGNEDEMPHGISGGPVVDLVRGEVIGVLKARRTARDGGLAVGIQQLRRLPVAAAPEDDLYHRVMSAHDLHHADRYANTRGQQVTWTDAHSEIGAVAGRALTAGQRTALLGRLALLPPPASARNLQDTVAGVRGSLPQGLPLAPRAWRDGLGLLYDLRRGSTELEAVLRYAVHAATADRLRAADDGAERALWHWAQEAAADAEGLTRLFRSTLVTERKARLRARSTLAVVDPAPPAPGAGRPLHPEALLEIIPRGWEPGRFDWRVSVLPVSGEAECIEEDFHGTAFHQLPDRLREPLDEAFRRCDEPGNDALLQLAVPGYLVAFAADTWPIGPGGAPLGAVRPVVVRRTDTPPWDDPVLAAERVDRWHTLHDRQLGPAPLDCDEGAANALPGEDVLRGHPRDTLPVLCRSGATGPDALHRLVRGGHPVALWRREPVEPDAVCDDFHRGIARTVRVARFAGRLPGALVSLRAAVADGVPEAYWSRGLALLYDDPTRPLPGTDELLETP